MNLRVASLFSGIGGIDLGFKQAGFDIVWANEIDKFACKTYRQNFGDTTLVEADIKSINPKDIPPFDVLVAGFPCQPFSIVGKQRGFSDDRGQLFFEIERIVKYCKPQAILLENVANLIEHDKGKSFEQVYLSLAKEGYVVRYDTLDPMESVNIPQHRNRVFLVAFLDIDKANKFVYPSKTKLTSSLNNYLCLSDKKEDSYYYTEKHPLYSSMIKLVKDKYAIYKITDYGINAKGHTICPTLTANMGTFPDRVPIIKDDFGIRKLTEYECLKLQGYPNDFKFPSNMAKKHCYKQVGNSVCVPIIKELANSIKSTFFISQYCVSCSFSTMYRA